MRLEPLDLTTKGTRNYIRGADIYSAAIDYLKPDQHAACKVAFRKLCRMLPIVSTAQLEQAPIAEMKIGDQSLWFYESDKEPSREPFDEDAIIWDSFGNSVSLASSASDHNPIDVVVALTKRLHYNARMPAGRWMLTRLDLQSILAPANTWYCVEIKTDPNKPLTRSSVMIDDHEIGSIYFSDM